MTTDTMPSFIESIPVLENMLYEEVDRAIYHVNCPEDSLDKCERRQLKDFRFKLIEIWTFKEQEEVVYSVDQYDLETSQVQDYLKKDEIVEPPEDKELLGGLRLLVQEWPRKWAPSDSDIAPQSPSLNATSLYSKATTSRSNLFPFNHPEPRWPPQDGEITDASFVSWLGTNRTIGNTEAGILPFDRDTLELMISTFCLPRIYPQDLTGGLAIPLRCTLMDHITKEGQIDHLALPKTLGIVLQSPKYDDERNFVSTALSYNPVNNITSGFFGYVKDETSKESLQSPSRVMENILLALKSRHFAPIAAHPLLIPSLVLNYWSILSKGHLDRSHGLLKPTQSLIREMEDDFYSWELLFTNAEKSKEDIRKLSKAKSVVARRYSTIKRYLVDTQNLALRESIPFAKALRKNCLNSLDSITTLVSRDYIDRVESDGRVLYGFLKYMTSDPVAYEQLQGRLLASIQLSFKELFKITQFVFEQYDAMTGNAMLSDSNKLAHAAERSNLVTSAISFISLVFLPATAIATVFGMVEFFTVEEGQFQISPTWTLYWKWTGSITGGLLLMWAYFMLTYSKPSPPPPPSSGIDDLDDHFYHKEPPKGGFWWPWRSNYLSNFDQHSLA